MDREEKTRDGRLRRVARRRALTLQRHKSRDPGHYLHGTYQLLDAEGNVVASKPHPRGEGYGLTLDEIEERLSGGMP